MVGICELAYQREPRSTGLIQLRFVQVVMTVSLLCIQALLQEMSTLPAF